ncbi:MAG: hypothetical protein R3B74_06865 [Nitrospirales bacterium]|nr:hypothetical protein [Nitrospirales bacterium]
MIRIKRVYREPSSHDGTRILVDRISAARDKQGAGEFPQDGCMICSAEQFSPKWFGHDQNKWETFNKSKRYRKKELSSAEPRKALKELDGFPIKNAHSRV